MSATFERIISNSVRRIARHKVVVACIVIVGIAILVSAQSSAVSATRGSLAERNIQGWIGQLKQDQLNDSRTQAQQNLELAGDAAVDPLLTSLASSNPVLRRNAAEVLGYIGSSRSMATLADTLRNDPDPDVRVEAGWALSQASDTTSAALLERALLVDVDSRVRQAADSALQGLQWDLATRAGYNVDSVRAFAVAPAQPNTVYLAVDDQVMVSNNGGKTFGNVGKTPSRVTSLAVSTADPTVVYAGTESAGLYTSKDGGTTWQAIGDNLGEESGLPLSITAIAFDSQNPERVYVAKGTWIGTSQARLFPLGVMTSRDGGQTWTTVDLPATQEPVTRLLLDGGTLYGLAGDRVVSAAQ